MSEFTSIDLTGAAPADLVCAECAASSGRLHVASLCETAYCQHRLSGALRIGVLPWWRLTNISRAVFNRIAAIVSAAEEDRLAGELEDEAERSTKN